MPREQINWEPDVRKAMELLKATDGKLQQDVDKTARDFREKAVSPLDIAANWPSFRPPAQ